MSKDIYLDNEGVLKTAKTDIYKGENILKIQVGNLYYAQQLGIDLARFIDPSVKIQPETFRAYTLQELVTQGVSIDTALKVEKQLDLDINYKVSTESTKEIIQ